MARSRQRHAGKYTRNPCSGATSQTLTNTLPPKKALRGPTRSFALLEVPTTRLAQKRAPPLHVADHGAERARADHLPALEELNLLPCEMHEGRCHRKATVGVCRRRSFRQRGAEMLLEASCACSAMHNRYTSGCRRSFCKRSDFSARQEYQVAS